MIWASSEYHERALLPMPGRRRNRRLCPYCPPGGRKSDTYGTANGVVLAYGCEWHMRMFVRGGHRALAIVRKRLTASTRR